jgi:O-acetylhomoserine (thiol)-lyase
LWLQEGVVSPEAARIATEGGLAVVMNRCIYKEAQRWRGHAKMFRPDDVDRELVGVGTDGRPSQPADD